MSQKYALLIGVNEHTDPKLAKLKAPPSDVTLLANLLKDSSIGAFDQVDICLNKTFSEIHLDIANFFAEKNADDLLLLYFTGHGMLDELGRLYLGASDTKHNRLSGSAISARFITEQMDDSLSRRQVFILDCCHSGAFTRGAKGPSTNKAVTKTTFEGMGYGKIVLTATDTTQFAWEGDEIIGETPNSVFTHYLIEGLKTGEADTNGDGEISLDEWYDFANSKTIQITNKQKPTKWVYRQEGMELIIAKNCNAFMDIPLTVSKQTKSNTPFLKKIFGNSTKSVLCPYCLTEIRYRTNFTNCPNSNCKEEIPPLYLQSFNENPPAFIQTIGFRMSGKSLYYQSLTSLLMQMGNFWRNYSFAPLNDYTLYYQHDAIQYFNNGILPPVTIPDAQKSYLMQLNNMERWGSRTLVVQDVSGEEFDTLQFPIRKLYYLLHVPVTLMLASPTDNLHLFNRSIDQLMNGYIQTLAKHKPNFAETPRRVIITLTKADLFVNDPAFNFPELVTQYLLEDPIEMDNQNKTKRFSLNMNLYIEKMRRISKLIRAWVSLDVFGKNMILLAQNNNIHLEFSVISSLGANPIDNKMVTNIRPYRVLDPFFWALDFQSQESDQ